MIPDLIEPDWPAPAWVRAVSTTRAGGVSQGPYTSLNLGTACGDAPDRVAENRHRLEVGCGASFFWLQQRHTVDCVEAGGTDNAADASWTSQSGLACCVLSADCLPVLFCHRNRPLVGAAHAGWRGLAAGVLESCLAAMDCEPGELLAWLGPCIGPERFEVGDEVRDAFTNGHPDDRQYFQPAQPGHWMADLPGLARARLQRAGLSELSGGHWCTYNAPQKFFSYRRDSVTGRMATGIWLACE